MVAQSHTERQRERERERESPEVNFFRLSMVAVEGYGFVDLPNTF